MPIRSIRKRKSSLTSSLWKVLNVLYEIIFVVQINCNALQQNAMKEAKAIKDNLSVLISQLPARVQQMKVVLWIRTILPTSSKSPVSSLWMGIWSWWMTRMRWLVLFVFSYRPGSSLQNQIYKTVQMTRTMNAAQVPQAVSLCFLFWCIALWRSHFSVLLICGIDHIGFSCFAVVQVTCISA